MSSKRHQRRKQCQGKRRYADEHNAKSAAFFTAKTFGGVFHHYKCRPCGGWHVGHKQQSKRLSGKNRSERKREFLGGQ